MAKQNAGVQIKQLVIDLQASVEKIDAKLTTLIGTVLDKDSMKDFQTNLLTALSNIQNETSTKTVARSRAPVNATASTSKIFPKTVPTWFKNHFEDDKDGFIAEYFEDHKQTVEDELEENEKYSKISAKETKTATDTRYLQKTERDKYWAIMKNNAEIKAKIDSAFKKEKAEHE
jgi:hypothetical protein